MLVADASVLVDYLRGGRASGTVLRRHLARGPLVIPALVAFELWAGANTTARRERVGQVLGVALVEPFTPALARLAGELDLRERGRGRTRPRLDLLIATHAISHDAPLATLDRDYAGIEGLDVLRVREEA